MSKTNTEIAVAVPQGSAAAATVPMAQQLKQGGKCCGSCCDYRRAVIIMSLVAILFNAIGFSAGRDPELTDDQLEDEIVSIQDDYATATLVTSIISIIMALVSLIGAIQFNQYMVGLNVLYSIINFIVTVVLGSKMSNEIIDVILENADDDYISDSDAETFERLFQYSVIASFAIGGLILAFWLYPSVMLIIEIRSGIMTRETYPREEFSCCCTSKS